jgi:ornithine cyclodeaminase/alanine dehydrogenase
VLYLTEVDVERLLPVQDAIDAIEACFRRIAAGAVQNQPRWRLGLDGGRLNVMGAVDHELGIGAVKSYGSFDDGRAGPLVLVFSAERPEVLAIIEADLLSQRRTGAATAVAVKHLAKRDACSLGVIGAGWQAEAQVECVRAALPGIERVVAYARTPDARRSFCERLGAEEAEYGAEPAALDVVVTVTNSRDPVLRGDWLHPGATVSAVGANRLEARELDNAVLARATFVCCDSVAQARIEAGDIVEPVERGVLDWLEVHELAGLVAGEVQGRQLETDIVVFKSLGIAAEDAAVAKVVLDRAVEHGVGRLL